MNPELFFIERAREDDVEHLLRLYQMTYGNTYPLRFGTSVEAAQALVRAEHDRWYVARHRASGRPVGSVVFEVEPQTRIGKVAGLVVHPDFRRDRLADALVREGTAEMLGAQGLANSIYATTRTNSIGPQKVMLANGYRPFGIFPNAHKLAQYETVALFIRHRPETLTRRVRVPEVPRALTGILGIIDREYGLPTDAERVELFAGDGTDDRPAAGPDLAFELILAPEYVHRRFLAANPDEYDRFYPFHHPNLLMASTNGEVEIYAYFNRQDRYCAVVSLTQPIHSLAGRIRPLLDQLKDFGVAYLEIMLGLEYGRSIHAALGAGFVPSALYPAMRLTPSGEFEDFIVLSRTLEPLDFRGMRVAEGFKPFIDQYVQLWQSKMIESLRVLSERAPIGAEHGR